MPLYDYDCAACGIRFEVIHGVHADSPDACQVCGGGPVRKAVTAPAVHFKGSGWAKKERRSAGASGSSGSSGDKDGGTSDAKATDAKATDAKVTDAKVSDSKERAAAASSSSKAAESSGSSSSSTSARD
jgi:putative FmdB family regulatory protein